MPLLRAFLWSLDVKTKVYPLRIHTLGQKATEKSKIWIESKFGHQALYETKKFTNMVFFKGGGNY